MFIGIIILVLFALVFLAFACAGYIFIELVDCTQARYVCTYFFVCVEILPFFAAFANRPAFVCLIIIELVVVACQSFIQTTVVAFNINLIQSAGVFYFFTTMVGLVIKLGFSA